MKKEYKNIIIGAGASGLMLGSLLDDRSDTLLIDANSSIGAKIAVSGGGKCNLTNESVDASNYLGDFEFVSSVLDGFDSQQTLAWFSHRGVTPEIRRDGQYFCTRGSSEVTALFDREIDGLELALDTVVQRVEKDGDRYLVTTDRARFVSQNLIIASGGLSFAKLGASGIGHEIAEQFGHTIVPMTPALVGFTLQPEQFFFKELSGVSVDVVASVDGHKFRGDMLFAHKGISGPAILSTSVYWKKGKITIDFLPDFSWRDLARSKKLLSTILPLSKRAVKAFLLHLGIDDQPANKLTRDERSRLEQMKHYSFAPAGTFGYTKAEVTRGGVSTEQIDPSSMMSLLESNLYFIGEVLDVTGELGGYNFQWAFSSAHRCAMSLNG